MHFPPTLRCFIALTLAGLVAAIGAEPVTPGATAEARALLATLSAISGKQVLTGQHNFPAVGSRNSAFAAAHTGKTPAVFSTDFGHARAGDTDSCYVRPQVVQETIRQHRLGAVVTICWHAVPPTADEPVTFSPLPGADPARPASVISKLSEAQFEELLTPGTPLHARWCAQVDSIAVYLKQLEAAGVPILWRPYHEMNGYWFWWGGHTGRWSTAALYRQLFDRLVHHHGLKNLVWVWSVDRMNEPGLEHEKYFPGIEYVDVLSLDVYENDFAQSYYESLVGLAQGKPLALAEVGNPPALDVFDRQPRWTFYVTWAAMARNTPRTQWRRLLADPRFLGLDDAAYGEAIRPLRTACGLPPLSREQPAADFSGDWQLDEERSTIAYAPIAHHPVRLQITQEAAALAIRSTRVIEYADDEITEERLPLDGTECRSLVLGLPHTNVARRSPDGSGLVVDSAIGVNWGPDNAKLVSRETWRLADAGSTLVIQRHDESFMGPQDHTLVFRRR